MHSSYSIKASQEHHNSWGGLKNYKILRKHNTFPSKGVGTFVCLPIIVLNLDSWTFLQSLFAISQDDIITVQITFIFL